MNVFFQSIERMKLQYVLGMMFCLITCVFYTPLAFAKGTDLARVEIQNEIGTLLEQIGGMDVGDIELGAGNDFTITRGDGSQYVFENMAHDASGVGSGTVSVYDSGGTLTETIALNKLAVADANRIDFEAQVTPVGGGDVSAVIGTLTGLRSTEYTAVGSLNSDGESRAVMIDYSGVRESGNMTASSVVLTPMDGDDVGLRSGAALALVIIIVVVVFVGATCFFFGWWGC